MNKTRGVIYCCHGNGKFLAEAIISAKSVNRASPSLKICLFHGYSASILSSHDTSIFTDIEEIQFPDNMSERFAGHMKGFLGKLCAIKDSPYDHTLFLDTDTKIIKPIDSMFDLLEKFDIGIAPGPMTQKPVNGEDLLNEIPDTFPEVNTGVILYRKTPKMVAFLEEWKVTFLTNKDGLYRMHGKGGDQVSLRYLLWSNEDIRMHIFSCQGVPNMFNFRWGPLDKEFKYMNHVRIHHTRHLGGNSK